MVGQNFIFCGKSLRDFGCIMALPPDDDDPGLNRDIIKGNVTSHRSQAVHYGTVYNSVITLPLFIVKFNCNDNSHRISAFELRKIQAWLTSPKTPQPLYMVAKNGEAVEYHGVFTEVSPYICDGLNGLNLKFVCDSPFAYRAQKATVLSGANAAGIGKTIFCDTDELEEFIYPTIRYKPNAAGAVAIKNNTDNGNAMGLNLQSKYGEVTIDCKLKRIVADGKPLSLHDAGLNISPETDHKGVNAGAYKMYWLRLLPGKNDVHVTGDGEFTIAYKNLLKLGGWADV